MSINLGRWISDRKKDIEDVFSPNTQRDQQRRQQQGQSQYYVRGEKPGAVSQPSSGYGVPYSPQYINQQNNRASQLQQELNNQSNISRVFDKARIFDANTKEDRLNRVYKGQEEIYRDQQLEAGDSRPTQNIGDAFLGGTARFVNTAGAEGRRIEATKRMLAADLTNNPVAWRNANRMAEEADKGFGKTGGLFNSGTLYNSDEAKKGELTTGLKRIGGGTLESGAELVGLGAGGFTGKKLVQEGFKQGIKGQGKNLGINAISNFVQGGAYSYNKDEPMDQVIKQAVMTGTLGTATDIGLGVVGYGANRVLAPNAPLNQVGAVGKNVNKGVGDPLESLKQEARKYKSAADYQYTTGDPKIDAQIKQVAEMSPDEYLKQAFEATDGKLGGSYDSWLKSNAQDAMVAKRYAEAMQNGDKFPIAYIDKAMGSQDGRNRALAAKLAGRDKMPVGIIPEMTTAEKIAFAEAQIKKYPEKSYLGNKYRRELTDLYNQAKSAPVESKGVGNAVTPLKEGETYSMANSDISRNRNAGMNQDGFNYGPVGTEKGYIGVDKLSTETRSRLRRAEANYEAAKRAKNGTALTAGEELNKVYSDAIKELGLEQHATIVGADGEIVQRVESARYGDWVEQNWRSGKYSDEATKDMEANPNKYIEQFRNESSTKSTPVVESKGLNTSDMDVQQRMMLDYFKGKPKGADTALTGEGAMAPTTGLPPEAKAKLMADAKAKVALKTTNILDDQRGGIDVVEPPKPKVKFRETSIDPDDPFNNRSIINRIRNEAGELIDDDSSMLKLLRKAEKQTGQKGLVDQWMFDSGNIRSSASIANAKIRNSEELKGAFSGLNKRGLNDFDEYAGARAELRNYDGLTTSRPQEELQAIVQAGDATFGKRFEALNQYYKSITQTMHDGGLISKQQLDNYLASDDYIRIQRDMEDLLNGGVGGSKARSLGSTTAGQKRKGSSRDILSPSKTALNRTQQIQLEVQRNKAATNIIGTLEELGIAERVDNTVNKNTISRLVDGERQIYQVPRDIKEVIDNVEPYRLGVIAKIVSAPTRLFRAGTTALSAPFTVTNYLRDQASSALYSKSALPRLSKNAQGSLEYIAGTHSPSNIIAGIGSATRDTFGESRSPLWKQFEEFAGDQTIFDELRNAKSAGRQLREVRLGNKGKYGNMATAPIRTLEDLNSITERATRFQNFKGIYEKGLATGKNTDEALRDAVLAARQNSVDFQRNSSFTRVVNLFIPYFNASIQGSRNVARSFRDRPISTSMKSVGLLAAPLAAVTAYNMSDDKRREAYNSINDFEKENNIIIIGPNAKQRDDGSWEGVYKIPRPQGYRELTDPVREVTEAFLSGKPTESVAEIAKDMVGGLTGPVNIQDSKKFVGSFIPQLAKPWIQLGMNQDLYTGSKIVPDFMVEGTGDPTKRAYNGSSGTARLIAEQLGVSPIQVEKAITDTAGSMGRYGINASDNLLSKFGVIGEDEIGGRSVKSDFSRRVGEASGELLDSNKSQGRLYFESREKHIKDVVLNKNEQAGYTTIHPDKTNFLGEDIFDENKRISKYTKAGVYLQFPKVFEVDKRVDAEQRAQGKPGNPLFDLQGDQLNQVLLKQALPPGASDPQLDNLWKEEWYQDYQNKNTKFFDAVADNMAKEGKTMPKSKNPYPETPKGLQKTMDYYSSLPKGTGDRSNWIKANPGLFKQMTDQWGKVDAWENKERVKLGLKELTDEDKDTGNNKYANNYGRGGGSGGGGGGKKYDPTADAYKYAVNLSTGNTSLKPSISVKAPAKAKVAKKGGGGKPTVTLKKSLV